MKKKIIYSILISMFFAGYNVANAEEVKANEYELVELTEQANTEEIVTVYETSSMKIVKQNDKYGIYDKEGEKFLVKPVLDGISKLAKNNDFEYKIQMNGMLGYLNLVTKDTFLSYFDDISLINAKYLNVKNGNYSGITDKKGKIIVPIENKKVSVTEYDGKEYLIGKTENKYNVFYNDGTLVSSSDFQTIDASTFGASVMKDLKPALKEYRYAIKKAEAENEKVYVAEDNSYVNIGELTSGETKDKQSQATATDEDVYPSHGDSSSIISTNYGEEDDAELAADKNVQKLAIKHEDFVSVEESANSNSAVEIMTLNDKSYYVINRNGNLGLQTKRGREIIPARFKYLKVKSLGTGDQRDVVVAVGSGDKDSRLYNTNGEVLAKTFQDKYNVYTAMRKYQYTKNGDFYTIEFNGKKIGELTVMADGAYKYTRSGFNLSNMKKVNDLFVTFLTSLN